MARQRLLSRAPVVEAVLDVRVSPQREITAEVRRELEARIGDAYPNVKEQRSFEATFEPSIGAPPRTATRDLGLDGLMFRSADDLNVAQFQRDGFAFSRLSPYTSWDEVLPEAMRLWDLYREYFQPDEARRVAVRYINRIPFPKADFQFDRFLASVPVVPEPLPQGLSAFLSTVIVHDPVRRASARITQSFEQPADSTEVLFLLDIEAFRTDDLSLDSSAIRGDLDLLRELKNDAFFAFLKDAAIERFEPTE